MNKVQKIFTENFILLIFVLMSLKLMFAFERISIYSDYIIYLCIILFSFFNREIFKKENAIKITKIFFGIFILQLIGLLQVHTVYSIHNILSSFIVYLFLIIMFNFNFKIRLNNNIFKIAYYAATFSLLIYTLNNIWLKNTITAIFLFLTITYIFINIKEAFKENKYIIIYFLMLLSMCLSYVHHSRTTFFITFIILLIFIILNKFNAYFKQDLLNKLFFCCILIIFSFVIFYINIKYSSLYDILNCYSRSIFNKNIDSGRPDLWYMSIKSLQSWQYIIGSGTGKLPEITRYVNSSFHNTYIQIFIQHGILGLVLLIMLFRKIWMIIIKNSLNIIMYFLISVFIAIIIYNCFETTLLQNKTLLGITQWFALGIGYQCIRGDIKEL